VSSRQKNSKGALATRPADPALHGMLRPSHGLLLLPRTALVHAEGVAAHRPQHEANAVLERALSATSI